MKIFTMFMNRTEMSSLSPQECWTRRRLLESLGPDLIEGSRVHQEAKPDAKLTCNLVRMRNKRPLAYQHQHPSFWRQLEILRKLKIGSSMGNFL